MKSILLPLFSLLLLLSSCASGQLDCYDFGSTDPTDPKTIEETATPGEHYLVTFTAIKACQP